MGAAGFRVNASRKGETHEGALDGPRRPRPPRDPKHATPRGPRAVRTSCAGQPPGSRAALPGRDWSPPWRPPALLQPLPASSPGGRGDPGRRRESVQQLPTKACSPFALRLLLIWP